MKLEQRKKRKHGVAEKKPVELICATGRGRNSEEEDVDTTQQ